MLNTEIEQLLLAISQNKNVLALLSVEQKESLLLFKAEKEQDILRCKEHEKMEQEAIERRRKEEAEKQEAERRELLCLGDWRENVPLHRRFALCERVGKRFIGWCGQESDPSKWKDEIEYCAIDLIRGFTSPYWGYWVERDKYKEMIRFFQNRIKPILDAKDDEERLGEIRYNWNIFPEEGSVPFRLLSYEILPDGMNIEVTGRSEYKTFEEHKDALKQEIEKNLVDK